MPPIAISPRSGESAVAPAIGSTAITLAVACAGALLALVSFTLPAAALPAIAHALNTGTSGQTWILSGISLSVAASLLTGGSLADDHGRKRLFLVGLGITVVASVASAAAPGVLLFVASRVLQGLGIAAILSSSLGLLAHAHPTGHARTRATAAWGAMIGGGIALGPLIGALFAAWWWRGAYLAIGALAALTLLAAAAFLDESRAETSRRVDPAGVLTLAGGLVAMLAGLIAGNRDGWAAPSTLGLIAAGLVLLAAFLAVEARNPEPMLDLRLFTRRAFVAALLASACTGASVVAMMTYLGTFVQRTLHVGAVGSALLLLAWSATSFAAAMLAPRVASWLSARAQLTAGLLLVAAGLALLLAVQLGGWPSLLPGLVLSGVGSGLLNAGLARAAVDTVPAARASMGSGANNMVRYVGNGVGVAIVVAAVDVHAPGVSGFVVAIAFVVAVSLAGAVAVLTLMRPAPPR